MTYESQKVAIKYFVISAIFFGLQVTVGLLLAAKYIWPDPLLELPVELKWAIVIVALIFIFNVFLTMIRTKKWTAIQGMLLGGIVMLAVMWLFGIPFFKNLTLDYYYWIGTPNYWLWWGGIFSALEPLPILFMVFDTLNHVRHRKLEVTNRLALYWAVGCAIFHFIGAGVWGFAHTLPAVNRWTHGTQVTASHGHMAFFGAYAMLILTVIYYALPKLKGLQSFNQKRGFWAFWITAIAMAIMGLAFGVAGVIQSYMWRGLGMDFLTVQGFMRPWFMIVLFGGLGLFTGVIIYIIDVLSLATKKNQ